MIDQYQNILFFAVAGLAVLLLIWNIVLQISLSHVKANQRILFAGKDAKSFEEIVLRNNQKINNLDNDIKDLYEITSKIHSLAHKGVHKVGVIRFNPFRDLGGDQSFSVALLDGNHSGVIISSLYSREGVRVYAKALSQGDSGKYPLTEEEKKAIELAKL